LLGSRVQRSPSNPALGILPRAFNRARDAPGIAQTRGFTLIEMLAVIVLIAIAASVAAVSLHGRSRGELQAAAQRVAAGLPSDATVHVESAAEAGDQSGIARIGYFPDGSSSGGNITLSEARRSARVDVDWLTGAVTVSKQP